MNLIIQTESFSTLASIENSISHHPIKSQRQDPSYFAYEGNE